MSTQEQHALALQVAIEWVETVSGLFAVTVDDAEIVTKIELKPEYSNIHPFYAGKISLLRMLKSLADADVDRYSAEGRSMLDELYALRSFVDDVVTMQHLDVDILQRAENLVGLRRRD